MSEYNFKNYNCDYIFLVIVTLYVTNAALAVSFDFISQWELI